MSEMESVEKIKLITSSGKEFVYENVCHLSCHIENSFSGGSYLCSKVTLEFYTRPSEPEPQKQEDQDFPFIDSAIPPSCSECKYYGTWDCWESTMNDYYNPDEEPPEWCPKRKGELFSDKEKNYEKRID